MRQDLKVPKVATAVTLTLVDGSVSTVELFLATSADSHRGPERVSDLLNGPGAFVAARSGDGKMSFVSAENVVLARVAASAEVDDATRLTLPMEVDLSVTLASGATVRGFVSYVRPSESGRLLDHLNDPAPFLLLFDGAEAVLVNKRLILRVEPTGA